MHPRYAYGRRKELQVAEFLDRRGFTVARSPVSRGAVDLLAWKGRKRLAIQVKSTRKDRISSARLGPAGTRRLVESALSNRAQPMLALVSRNYVWLLRVPDWAILMRGALRLLEYDYIGHT